MIDIANLKATANVKLTKINEDGSTVVEESTVELSQEEARELWQLQTEH